jgi:hypothetical protein
MKYRIQTAYGNKVHITDSEKNEVDKTLCGIRLNKFWYVGKPITCEICKSLERI